MVSVNNFFYNEYLVLNKENTGPQSNDKFMMKCSISLILIWFYDN